MATIAKKPHHDGLAVVWEGNRGTGTPDYGAYGRQYRVSTAGKPDLGRAVLFQHRALHEATRVRAGEKFVLRTHVLFEPPADRG